MERVWSGQQSDIFSWFEQSNAGNSLIIRARAGTGKSTTILEGVNKAPETSILMCAFNKNAAGELKARIKNPYGQARTLHSLGFGYVRKFWTNVQMANGNERVRAHAMKVAGSQAPDDMLSLIAKLATKGKEMAPLATGPDDLTDLAYEFDCVPDEEWEEYGWDVETICQRALQVMDLAAQRDGKLDFSDQLFVPIRNKWIRGSFDLVVVDEAQDMNTSQILLAQKSVKKGGRIAVVGDDRQAIYAFRGADSGSIDRLKTELSAVEMGLTITYRCPKAVVALAKQLVPDYEAAEAAPDGKVDYPSIDQMLVGIQPGDFLLSRRNAPIAGLCLKILKQGKRARFQGKDIGDGLISLVNRWKSRSMPEFLDRLRSWEERESHRATISGSRNADARVDKIVDQAETIRELAQGLTGLPELKTRIKELFTDDGRPAVMCSSIHRAKGLESDNVYVLSSTLRSRTDPPCTCHHWAHPGGKCKCGCTHYVPDDKKLLEEQNLEYVAVTRSKQNLFMVQGEV